MIGLPKVSLKVGKPIEQIKNEALKALGAASDIEEIKVLANRYLGRKGAVTHCLRNISSLPVEKRSAAGKKANEIKNGLDKAFKAALTQIKAHNRPVDNRIDVSLPGRTATSGSLHPITQVNREICDILPVLGLI